MSWPSALRACLRSLLRLSLRLPASLHAPFSTRLMATPPASHIDCSCYYTTNLFVNQTHYNFRSRAEFEREHAAALARLGEPERLDLIQRLLAEQARRRGLNAAAAHRTRAIASGYTPLHPQLWRLSADFLHPDLVRIVHGELAPRMLAHGVYALPVFSPLFCRLVCEELAHFAASGMPAGRPNSMNRAGLLLDELGLGGGLLDPFLREYLSPLCKAIPVLRAAGGEVFFSLTRPISPICQSPFFPYLTFEFSFEDLERHKSFVVSYRMGDDEQLSAHFDNAEVTLNVNIGLEFEGGELVFHGGPHGLPSDTYHEWGTVGHGVLHLGRQIHSALPNSRGERHNLVVWMRSPKHRRVHGCPMCGRTDLLLEEDASA